MIVAMISRVFHGFPLPSLMKTEEFHGIPAFSRFVSGMPTVKPENDSKSWRSRMSR